MLKKVASLAALLLAAPVFAQSQGSEQVQAALGKGIMPFLAVSFVGGLVALLTPCVFPMVPVTVSFFAKRKDRPLLSALIYAFGIISTFAILGVLASVIFGAAGIARFATNPWVNIGLAVLFVVLALNLFGLYEFQLGFAGRLQGKALEKKDSLLSPWLVGMAFSLTSFTCTGPIVAGLLAIAAGKGGPQAAMLGMTSFGIAFSLPFFFLALFPAALAKAPKSGGWLGVVKPALGFIELAAAFKFLSNADLVWQLGILTRPVFVAIWGILALALGLFLLGVPKQLKQAGWIRRGLGVLSLIGALMLFMNPHGQNLTQIAAFLPNDPYPYRSGVPAAAGGSQLVASGANQAASNGKIQFLSSYEKALALAKQENKPVFVDFTGVTCTNCRWMEDNVFPDPTVHGLLTSMVTVQLYTDRGTDADNANQELQQKIGGTIALPVYVLVSPDGKVIKTFEGRSDTTQQFADFLKQAKSG